LLIVICTVILAACGLGAACVLLKAGRMRAAIYRYDVTRDQRFDFPPSRTVRSSGRLTNGRIEFAQRPPGSGVVFLELQVRSTLLGRWFEPYIEIESAQRRWRQPFERDGSGRRYLELSQIIGAGETSAQLTGHYLEIPDQSVALYYLQQDVDLDTQRILVLGTHPDDAEIAAFGVYCERDAYVITLTAGESGEPGPFARFGHRAYDEKGRIRAWNSVAVPMLGGLSIQRTANLGYFDGTLPAMREHPSSAVRSLHAEAEFLDTFGQSSDASLIAPRSQRRATWANLVADLEHLVKRLQPEVLVAPYPRLDAHPDHKMSTMALVEALKNLNWRKGSLLLYTNHLCSSDRYPFGDAGDLVSLPPGIENIYFDGIVSQPLDRWQQARKHMALDAMIDLRPDLQADSLRGIAQACKSALKSSLTDAHTNYFRQAVRANELFFEVHVSSLYEPGVIDRIYG
jgi:LmbE family N-acetylglucosaminyl deacetylase